MESAILGALMASTLVAGVVLAVLGGARRAAPATAAEPPGRLRLPVRAFERAVVIAVVAAAGGVAPTLGDGDDVWLGAVVVAVAVAWCARRGAFLPPRADERTPEER